jgi:hypothetical protein
VHGTRGGEGDQPEAERRDRVEAGRRQRYAAQRGGAEETHPQTDAGTRDEFVDHVEDQALGVERERHRAEHQHEDHRGGVVEPGFRLEQAGDPARQRQHAQDREHGGGIGRRDDRADE